MMSQQHGDSRQASQAAVRMSSVAAVQLRAERRHPEREHRTGLPCSYFTSATSRSEIQSLPRMVDGVLSKRCKVVGNGKADKEELLLLPCCMRADERDEGGRQSRQSRYGKVAAERRTHGLTCCLPLTSSLPEHLKSGTHQQCSVSRERTPAVFVVPWQVSFPSHARRSTSISVDPTVTRS